MREQISALMDGELDEAELATVLQALEGDAELEGEWQAYHLIGEALRGEKVGVSPVAARVSAQLAGEPALRAAPRLPADVADHDPSSLRERPAANRILYSVAASLAGVAFVAWAVWQAVIPAPAAAPASGSLLAAHQAPAAQGAQPVAYPSQVQDYWMAHRQLSGHMSDAQDQQVQFVSVETSGEDRQ